MCSRSLAGCTWIYRCSQNCASTQMHVDTDRRHVTVAARKSRCLSNKKQEQFNVEIDSRAGTECDGATLIRAKSATSDTGRERVTCTQILAPKPIGARESGVQNPHGDIVLSQPRAAPGTPDPSRRPAHPAHHTTQAWTATSSTSS